LNINYRLKTFGKALTPPILLGGGKAILGLISKSKQEHGERDPDWYDRAFSRTEESHKHYTESRYYFLWSIIAHLLTRDGVSSVLDVGCGSGQFALLLRDQGIKKYCGIDFSHKRIEWARTQCPDFTFVVEDALQTDLFRTFDYDAVVCTEFLEHIKSDLEVIRKIRPGARFYGVVPNFPFSSHVRYFKSIAEVTERYARYFKDFRVSPFFANRKGKTCFLLEGKKL